VCSSAVHGLVFPRKVTHFPTMATAFEVRWPSALFHCVHEPMAVHTLLIGVGVDSNPHIYSLCIHEGGLFGQLFGLSLMLVVDDEQDT